MHIRRLASAVGLVAAAWTALPAAAADPATGWPTRFPAGWDGRGLGGGLAIVPAVLWWLCILGWMRSVDWVTRDSTKLKLTPAFWGMVCGVPLFVAATMAWWIPSVLAGLALMLVAWLAPVITYAMFRNAKVPVTERVLTVGHARRLLAEAVHPLGIELDTGTEAAELLPQVALVASGGKDAAENAARVEAASALPGFEEARKTMVAAVVARASTLVIDCEPAGMGVRHEVDGVWDKRKIRQPPRSRAEKESWVEAPKSSLEVGQAVVASLKALCGLPTSAKEAKNAPFLMQVDGKPRNCRLTVRRRTEGEQVSIQIDFPATIFKKLADLGMPGPIAEKVIGLTAVEKGLILVSAPEGSGLTTTFDLLVQSTDRLLRDFISLEDAAAPPREIQNVRPVPFDARTGVAPLDALEGVLRTYPNVIVTRDVSDKALVTKLVELADSDKFVIMSLKASDAIDAIARVLACGVPPQTLARTIVGSLSQRLVRRLCPKCREEYPKEPESLPKPLAKMQLTEEQRSLLRKPSEHGCRLCGGTGYFGRAAMFELASGPTIRKTVAAGSDASALRAAAREDGMVPLRDAGLQLVLEGVTSLDELQRVLAPPASPSVAPPAAPRPDPSATRRKST
jgi:type II secretory ATPase GspE/PulE/Tfp pilus assembly ATPase PilB-like protein